MSTALASLAKVLNLSANTPTGAMLPQWEGIPLGGRDWETKHLPEGLRHIGGYAYEGIDEIIAGVYGPTAWDIYSVPVPDPEAPAEAHFVKALLKRSAWANVRDRKIHFLFIYGAPKWAGPFDQFGLSVTNEAKVAKRVAGLMAARALSLWTRSLSVLEVEETAYTDGDYGEDNEKLLDGAGIIARSIYERMVQGWEDRVINDYDPFIAKTMGARFDRAIMLNVRVFESRGLWKGNFMIMDDDVVNSRFGGHYDIIVPKNHIKAGVTMPAGRFFVTAEVQEWHARVRTDVQSMTNLRALFTDAHMKQIVTDNFAHVKARLKAGKLLESVGELVNAHAKVMRKRGEVDYADLATRWAAAEWVARGLDLRQSESLLRGVARAKIERVLHKDKRGKIQFKLEVPCAWHMQVISLSAARFFGYRGKVANGFARVWWSKKMIVLSDEDWITNYMNFGGHDLDDFFKVFFRTVEGRRCLILIRSPNGYGEYAVFDFHEGDKFPTWKKANGDKEEFPLIKGRLPKQLTKAIDDGTSVILPLDNSGVEGLYTGDPVTRSDVWGKIQMAINQQVHAGQLVNVAMLWSLVMGSHIPMTVGTMEDFIDLTTQADLSPEAAISLNFMSSVLLASVVSSGRPIDRKFWEDRNFAKSKVFKDLRGGEVIPEPNLVDSGPAALFSVRTRTVETEVEKFLAFAKNLSRRPMAIEGLESLGKLAVGKFGGTDGKTSVTGMAAVLRLDYRRTIARANEDDKDNAFWQNLFSVILEAITIDENDDPHDSVTQYDNVLGLFLAARSFRRGQGYCQVRTCGSKFGKHVQFQGEQAYLCRKHRETIEKEKDKRIANKVELATFPDTVVTNRVVFPLLMEAMEFYGLCEPLGMEPGEWAMVCTCRKCGKTHTTDRPTTVQRYHANGETCKACRAEDS